MQLNNLNIKYLNNYLVSIFLVFLMACSNISNINKVISLDKSWKFKTGNNPDWAKPTTDDSKWDSISTEKCWESQGYKDYDGYAWYRIKVIIPTSLKENSYLKDSIRFILGKINDDDQFYLSGALIGENNKVLPKPNADPIFEKSESWNIERNYMIPVTNPNILWDKENVIAVRVFDQSGNGGFYGSHPQIQMQDISDYLIIDKTANFRFESDKINKTYTVKNKSAVELSGLLTISVNLSETQKFLFNSEYKLDLKPGEWKEFPVSFKSTESSMVNIAFKLNNSKIVIETEDESYYILTPKPGDTPRINCAKVTGVRPGNPFLYKIPCHGERPIHFSVKDLPSELKLNPLTGIITGKITNKGEYEILIEADNSKGKDSKKMKIVVGDKLALTPPMGWNHWYYYYDKVTDKIIREAADIMFTIGMADVGYQYINIDDCWMNAPQNTDPKRVGPLRDKRGNILPNSYFPDMKGLTDYIHNKGLKVGIYTSPGPFTCGGFAGTYQHEQQDACQFAAWGFDFLKYDLCSYESLIAGTNNSLETMQKPYLMMGNILKTLDRDMVFNLCQYGMGEVWKWGGKVGGHCWRTGDDLGYELNRIYEVALRNSEYRQYSKPGEWNDPDYIQIGWIGNVLKMGTPEHIQMSPSMQYAYMSLWCLMAAPLIYSGDMTRLDEFTINVLCNPEVIEVDQDPLGECGLVIKQTNDHFLMVKNLVDGSKAVGLFNRGKTGAKVVANFTELKLSGKQIIRNLWCQKNLGEFEGKFTAFVPAQGVVLIKLTEK